jgi:hypothetical protein
MGTIEKIYPYILGLIAPFAVWYLRLTPNSFENFKDIMASTISLGSIAVGFLAAAITLMPSMNENSLVKRLKELGAYRKLLKYLIEAIIALFIVSLLSIFGLFLNSKIITCIDISFMHLWTYVFAVSILGTFRVISNFLRFLILTQDG